MVGGESRNKGRVEKDKGRGMISIIIPVYQAKQNIEQILGDIFAQTYQDYEILLVDDGSTDGSAEKCREYGQKNEKVRAILKEHSGVSETRNAGIAAARGEYISFVDSDDRIDPDYLERLVQGIGDYDLIISSFDRRFYKEGKYIRTVRTNPLEVQIDMMEALGGYFSYLYISTLIGTVVCKLFKKEIIEKYHVTFRRDIYIGEDYIFNFDYLRHCGNIRCIDYVGYHYICRNGDSLTHKKDLHKFEYGKILFRESMEFCKRMNLPDEAAHGVANLYLRTCFKNVENLYQMEEKIGHREKKTYIKRVMTDEDTRRAITVSEPDCMEFKIYKIILKLGIPQVTGSFSWLRLQYKKMLGRA